MHVIFQVFDKHLYIYSNIIIPWWEVDGPE